MPGSAQGIERKFIFSKTLEFVLLITKVKELSSCEVERHFIFTKL